MESLNLVFEGDGAFEEIKDNLVEGRIDTIACLAGGTADGKPSVAILVEYRDQRFVLAQTTMRLFISTAKVMEARFGAELGD